MGFDIKVAVCFNILYVWWCIRFSVNLLNFFTTLPVKCENSLEKVKSDFQQNQFRRN